MNTNLNKSYFLTIIGGGAVGIYISNYLSDKKNILLIESGSRSKYTTNDSKNIYKTSGNYKNGKRSRGLGGTTNLWGGQMLPFCKYDLSTKNNWPFNWLDLQENYESVSQKLLGESFLYENKYIQNLNESLPKIKNPLLEIHFSKWLKEPKFKKKLSKEFNYSFDKIFNGTVKFIEKTSSNFYLVSFEDEQKNIYKIKTKNVIVAAGTIETNRLLLVAKKYKKLEIDSKIGFGFMDHISSPICELKPNNRFKFLKNFNTRYLANGNKYSVRISSSEKLYKLNKSLNISSGIQVSQPKQLWKRIINLIFSFLSVKIYGVVIKPFGKIKLTVIVEQLPIKSRRITLSNEDLPYIKWKKTKREALTALKFADLVTKELYKKKYLSKKPKLPKLDKVLDDLIDVNHPMGGTSMNIDASESIVTKDLELKGFPNLYICSASIFKTGSHSNPTMTLLALADKLINIINKKKR